MYEFGNPKILAVVGLADLFGRLMTPGPHHRRPSLLAGPPVAEPQRYHSGLYIYHRSPLGTLSLVCGPAVVRQSGLWRSAQRSDNPLFGPAASPSMTSADAADRNLSLMDAVRPAGGVLGCFILDCISPSVPASPPMIVFRLRDHGDLFSAWLATDDPAITQERVRGGKDPAAPSRQRGCKAIVRAQPFRAPLYLRQCCVGPTF